MGAQCQRLRQTELNRASESQHHVKLQHCAYFAAALVALCSSSALADLPRELRCKGPEAERRRALFSAEWHK